jgi:predicted O-linked N-acetylglucosamine transferase (SPINDLY family)
MHFGAGGVLAARSIRHRLTAMAKPLPSKTNELGLRQLLARGMDFHRMNLLREAEPFYRQVLEARPRYPEAQHMLGVLRAQQGRLDEALKLVGAALKSQPSFVAALSDFGLILHKLDRDEEAIETFDKVLAIRPDHAAALNNRGNALVKLGRGQEALASYERALAIRPDYADAFCNRGRALLALRRFEAALASYDRALALGMDTAAAHYGRGNALCGLERYAEALASYERSLALERGCPEAWVNHGNALTKLGRNREALESYGHALTLNPDDAGTLANRGHVLHELECHAEALESYKRALALRPDDAEALNGRGNVLLALGHHEEALASYQQAIAARPDYAEAHYNRGVVAQELDRYETALDSFDKALAIKPDYAEASYGRGYALRTMNRWREAIEAYERALALKPNFPEARFALCVAQLPVLYGSEAEIAERRATYHKQLGALCDHFKTAGNTHDFARAIGSNQPFFLGYQGLNERELQGLYGSLVCRIMAERYPPAPLPPLPRHDEPVRVGVVSGFFSWHSVWKAPVRGWITQLDRRKFQIFGYHTGSRRDSATEEATATCDRFVNGPMPIERWRTEILRDAPHVLIYPEVGMDAVSAALAAQRLAPVQCNSWGHPVTSGYPTLDYYLSSALMEPPDGEHHYTERLVRLPNLSIYYEPLDPVAVPLDRPELGLRPSATVFWCGQSLYKYLPQFDAVFARIAKDVGDCQFVFIKYRRGGGVTELMKQRLGQAFSAFGLREADHCVFLPPLDQARFVAAIGQCDIALDSIGWSGFNSTMESLSHDLPIVTFVGSSMRGRHTASVLTMMGVTETIVERIEDYVATAVRLGRDVQWRMEVKSRIAAAKHRIFRDRMCIAALEEFIDSAARAPTADQ